MYAKRLDVDAMLRHEGEYDGVAAYARTKRGQVVLSELWAEQLAAQETTVHAMHPGWAGTPGVERSLPRFWQRMQGRLRTPEEGADTIVWLAVAERAAASTGLFWLDREPVSTDLFPWTRESGRERARLWQLCESHAGG
jgi:NAD(P)-dependent dehydrogenase (short-subunit alcohol dehydrogenase family)